MRILSISQLLDWPDCKLIQVHACQCSKCRLCRVVSNVCQNNAHEQLEPYLESPQAAVTTLHPNSIDHSHSLSKNFRESHCSLDRLHSPAGSPQRAQLPSGRFLTRSPRQEAAPATRDSAFESAVTAPWPAVHDSPVTGVRRAGGPTRKPVTATAARPAAVQNAHGTRRLRAGPGRASQAPPRAAASCPWPQASSDPGPGPGPGLGPPPTGAGWRPATARRHPFALQGRASRAAL